MKEELSRYGTSRTQLPLANRERRKRTRACYVAMINQCFLRYGASQLEGWKQQTAVYASKVWPVGSRDTVNRVCGGLLESTMTVNVAPLRADRRGYARMKRRCKAPCVLRTLTYVNLITEVWNENTYE